MTKYLYIVHIPYVFDRLNDADMIPDTDDIVGTFTNGDNAEICIDSIVTFAKITGWIGHVVLTMTDGTSYEVMDYYPVNQ